MVFVPHHIQLHGMSCLCNWPVRMIMPACIVHTYHVNQLLVQLQPPHVWPRLGSFCLAGMHLLTPTNAKYKYVEDQDESFSLA